MLTIRSSRLRRWLAEMDAAAERVPVLVRPAAATLARAATTFAASVSREYESGRDAHQYGRAVRGPNGRRLRSSLYNGGRPGGGPQADRGPVSGGWLPAGVKLALVFLIAGGAFLGSSQAYLDFAADLPDAHAIAAEPLPEDTHILASDGQTVLADIHPEGVQHYYQPLNTMGKWLPEASIAIEDQNFYSEPGIDPGGIIRAAWVDYHEHKAVQGASTITQQLVKLRLLDSSQTLDRKLKEAVLALQVEHTYSKDQILEQYLNTVHYGNNAQGSLAAARIYFHKETKDLDLAQASMLAGIPQSPLFNSPITNWARAKARQQEVLSAMVRTHKISSAEADQAYSEDISPPAHMFTPAPQVVAAPGFSYWVIDQLVAKYGKKTVYGGGLTVVTTLNAQLQGLAEQAVRDDVAQNGWRGFHQAALVSIDPHTGAVVAMVGAADTNENGGQYNMAVWPPRNPGSSMKIYNYTAAIESGKFTMVTSIPDTPLTIHLPPGSDPATYQPKNYDLKYHGTCQLQQCMGNSLNVPAVKVELGVGVPAVVDEARKMGAPPWISHPDGSYTNDDPNGSFGYSLTLGGYGETPLQMATGASVLGAQGVLHPPYGISSITASDGSPIFKADPAKAAKQALDPKVAFIMEQIMSDDDNRAMIFGRGSALTLPGRRVGAKTGTTDDFADGWTLGYTPALATAVWAGNPDWRQKMVTGSDGVYVAAPAWHEYMANALNALGRPGDEWFAEPPGLGHATVGGKTVWLLPGTSANQPMPPLPSFASSGSTPSSPSPSQPSNPTQPGAPPPPGPKHG